MNLASLKFRAKGSLFILLLALYGVSFFFLGRFTYPRSSDKIKGVQTSETTGDIIEKPQPYADEQRAEIISNSVKICSNATFGFGISYPRDWFTTQNNEPQKCTFFAPFSFVVPQLVDSDIVPIKVEVAKADTWQSTISLYTEPNEFQNIDTVQNIEINGRPAILVGSLSTGKNQIPKGFFRNSYLISDPKIPLILSYTQLNQNEDLESNKKVLKNMAESINYF